MGTWLAGLLERAADGAAGRLVVPARWHLASATAGNPGPWNLPVVGHRRGSACNSDPVMSPGDEEVDCPASVGDARSVQFADCRQDQGSGRCELLVTGGGLNLAKGSILQRGYELGWGGSVESQLGAAIIKILLALSLSRQSASQHWKIPAKQGKSQVL